MASLAVWYGVGTFLLLSLLILVSIGIILHHHEEACIYDLTIPCYTDWKCDENTDDPSSFTINSHFKNYFNECLGGNNGVCRSGCTPTRDYTPSFNVYAKNYNPYPAGDGGNTFNPPYPNINNPENDFQGNICATVPTAID
jgi:hypothetical protein